MWAAPAPAPPRVFVRRHQPRSRRDCATAWGNLLRHVECLDFSRPALSASDQGKARAQRAQQLENQNGGEDNRGHNRHHVRKALVEAEDQPNRQSGVRHGSKVEASSRRRQVGHQRPEPGAEDLPCAPRQNIYQSDCAQRFQQAYVEVGAGNHEDLNRRRGRRGVRRQQDRTILLPEVPSLTWPGVACSPWPPIRRFGVPFKEGGNGGLTGGDKNARDYSVKNGAERDTTGLGNGRRSKCVCALYAQVPPDAG